MDDLFDQRGGEGAALRGGALVGEGEGAFAQGTTKHISQRVDSWADVGGRLGVYRLGEAGVVLVGGTSGGVFGLVLEGTLVELGEADGGVQAQAGEDQQCAGRRRLHRRGEVVDCGVIALSSKAGGPG